MAELVNDILYYIFQNLDDLINTNKNNQKNYKTSLFSCLLVNKLWCEVMIPILWSCPYKYVCKKEILFNIIISHLSDNLLKRLIDDNSIEANFKKQKLSFNYVKYCKYLNNIHKIFPKESWFLKEEIYKLFISECSSIKCLSDNMFNYSIYKYPGANISLSYLNELDCRYVSIIGKQGFHELTRICRSIEKIRIITYEDSKYHLQSEIAELIEMQKQIQYIYLEEYGVCKRIAQALEKQAVSIVHLNLTMHTSSLYFLFPKLINLQFLRIYDENKKYDEYIEYVMDSGYSNLQILELQRTSLNIAINIIKNTNGNLYKIKIRFADCNKAKEYNQTIHKYCPNIKYVTVFLISEGTLEELENIFLKCQHLVAIDICEFILENYQEKFLDLLIELAPLTLYKFYIDSIGTFDKESLKLFFTNWNSRCKKTLHLYLLSVDSFYREHKIITLNYYDDDFWNHEITWPVTLGESYNYSNFYTS